MTSSSKHDRRPTLACEIAADRVLAGRAADAGRMVEMASARELAPGTVVPDLMEANLRDGTAIRQAIESALGSVAGRSRDVIAILPDTAVRVVLLDFETLPSKRDEAEAVVRFRLKKSLPFDPADARISYHAQATGKNMRAVAAVVLNTVLQEYESAFRDAGYNPGMVMPSMLAALGAADAERPTLVVKVDARTITQRKRRLMSLQRKISRAANRALVGQEMPVLVEGPTADSELVWQARLATQAPDIDGVCYISDPGEAPLRAGQIRRMRITQAHDYDLTGELVDTSFEDMASAPPALVRIGAQLAR